MARLMQGIASSDATTTQRLIVPMCTDTDVSYIEYLSFTKSGNCVRLSGESE